MAHCKTKFSSIIWPCLRFSFIEGRFSISHFYIVVPRKFKNTSFGCIWHFGEWEVSSCFLKNEWQFLWSKPLRNAHSRLLLHVLAHGVAFFHVGTEWACLNFSVHRMMKTAHTKTQKVCDNYQGGSWILWTKKHR